MSRRLVATAFAALACYIPPEKASVRVELGPELASRAREIRVEPAIAELRRQVSAGVVLLELNRAAGHARLVLPGACPVRVELGAAPVNQPREVTLRPLFEIGPAERVAGLHASFELIARPSCDEARTATTSFEVTGGAPLESGRLEAGGRRFSGVTKDQLPSQDTAAGIVAVSARAQQALRTEVTFSATLRGDQRYTRKLGISAVARASGLSDVGLTHPVLLRGDGWQLLDKPRESQADLRQAGSLFELLPDRTGSYRLRDASGRALTVSAGRYDELPLDCGRSDCHSEIARTIADSPMTQVLASDLGGCHTLSDPSCATACHTTGEPGTADGGFAHVAAELSLSRLPDEYDDLPVALRRVGGVGCMACHGPTKLPEPSQRFVLAKSSVCAVCHDAPPRYGHVQAWNTNRMALADRDPATRRAPACARCHTAWGRLGRPAPPEGDEGMGITCATCHDVHPHSPASGGHSKPGAAAPTSLLRQLPLPTTLASPPASFLGPSRVCIDCHAPSSSAAWPEASASLLVAGQGGVDPRSGNPMSWPSPHAQSSRGCLSCHDSGPDTLTLGKSHAFRTSDQACARCHGAKPRDPALSARARRLFAELSGLGRDEPAPHRTGKQLDTRTQRARALYDVLLVLEDPAADVHNPRFARALLDAAENLEQAP